MLGAVHTVTRHQAPGWRGHRSSHNSAIIRTTCSNIHFRYFYWIWKTGKSWRKVKRPLDRYAKIVVLRSREDLESDEIVMRLSIKHSAPLHCRCCYRGQEYTGAETDCSSAATILILERFKLVLITANHQHVIFKLNDPWSLAVK